MNMYMDNCEMSLSALTLPGYYRIIKSFDDFLVKINYTGEDIALDIINEWIMSLQPRKNTTICNYQRVVSCFLKFSSAYGIHYQMPKFVNKKDDYIPHIFTDDERERIFAYLDSYEPGTMNKNLYIKAVLPMAIRIMDSCGTRETETLMLQMKDVDLKNGTLTLRNTKRDKERIVPITKSLKDILSAYCLAMGIFSTPDAYLFPGLTKDEPLNSDTFSHLIPRILSKANVERNKEKKYSHSTSAHCFRHSFACRSLEHMIDVGFDEADRFPYLSTFLGHENLYSTQKYLQYPTDRMDSDVEKFESYGEDIFSAVPVMQEDISTWIK